MNSKKIITLAVALFVFAAGFAQQQVKLHGVVRDETGVVMELVHVTVLGSKQGTATKADGSFELSLSAGEQCTLEFSFMGFTTVRKQLVVRDQMPALTIQMQSDNTEIESVTVSKSSDKEPVGTRLSPKLVTLLPGSSLSGIEATIKTLPGVATTSELSSQYNVRGGNFDENLTYVNGMPVYKPILIRSGQQEGFSFVNSDLVSGIQFSSGGFGVEYGDKMSSVLDIRYREPRSFTAGASASLMGGAVHIDGYSKKAKLSHITGFRYKNNSLVLNTLDDKGEYHPQFLDVQTSLVWRPNDFWSFNTLGYVSRNSYRFTPQSKETVFGTNTSMSSLSVGFEGQEVDRFYTYYGAFIANYRPTETLRLSMSAANNYSDEAETYDIGSAYNLKEAGVSDGGKLSDTTQSLAYGEVLRHARNYLTSNVTDLQHTGQLKVENHTIRWGTGAQFYQVHYQVDEWSFVDSAGYASPLSDTAVTTQNKQKNTVFYHSNNFYVNALDDIRFRLGTADLVAIPGLRLAYYPSSNEFLTSPRIRFTVNPHWASRTTFHLSSGIYYQPVFFKELIDVSGKLHNNVKAQRSIHYVIGASRELQIWERPFKFTAEVYYKDLQRLIPYTVENVKIQYHPEQSSHGYATGLDMKLNGEFVKGTESWISLSIMQTREDIAGDNSSWMRRPADQLVNLGIFFQDYLPFDNSYKMQLAMYYGTDLPTWNPSFVRQESTTATIPSYQRVDIGFSKQILPTKQNPDRSNSFIKSLSIWGEVFNILDTRNKISYMWIPSIDRQRSYAVPNYLTSRMLNLKISASF